jgi:hypothetical protein
MLLYLPMPISRRLLRHRSFSRLKRSLPPSLFDLLHLSCPSISSCIIKSVRFAHLPALSRSGGVKESLSSLFLLPSSLSAFPRAVNDGELSSSEIKSVGEKVVLNSR